MATWNEYKRKLDAYNANFPNRPKAFPLGSAASVIDVIGQPESQDLVCTVPNALGYGSPCLVSSGDKYFVMTGYFEVQDLRTVTVQFQATNAYFLSMVVGEMINGVYTETNLGLAYENNYMATLVNKTPGHRYPVRIEYTPSHLSGNFYFWMFVDGVKVDTSGLLKYFYYTSPSPPPPTSPSPPPAPPELDLGGSFYGLDVF